MIQGPADGPGRPGRRAGRERMPCDYPRVIDHAVDAKKIGPPTSGPSTTGCTRVQVTAGPVGDEGEGPTTRRSYGRGGRALGPLRQVSTDTAAAVRRPRPIDQVSPASGPRCTSAAIPQAENVGLGSRQRSSASLCNCRNARRTEEGRGRSPSACAARPCRRPMRGWNAAGPRAHRTAACSPRRRLARARRAVPQHGARTWARRSLPQRQHATALHCGRNWARPPGPPASGGLKPANGRAAPQSALRAGRSGRRLHATPRL